MRQYGQAPSLGVGSMHNGFAINTLQYIIRDSRCTALVGMAFGLDGGCIVLLRWCCIWGTQIRQPREKRESISTRMNTIPLFNPLRPTLSHIL